MRYHTIGLIEGFPIFVAHVYRLLGGEETPWIHQRDERRSNMKKQSTGQIGAKAKREIEALKGMPDSEVNFSDIPLQNPSDPKWANAVVGKFYRPIKQPVALRVDADVLAWFKEQGPGYQSRMNEVLRREMMSRR